MAVTTLTTLSGTDLTQAQIQGMILEIAQFQLTLVADFGTELKYKVDDKEVDRATGLKISDMLLKTWTAMLLAFPGSEEVLHVVDHGAHHEGLVLRLTHG